MEAKETPALAAGTEGRAQLITETERRDHVSVTRTRVSLGSGRTVERVDGELPIRQCSELVDVVFEELVREEALRRLLRYLFQHRSGEQQRGRVDGSAEDGVDSQDVHEPFDDLALQRGRTQPGMTAGNQFSHRHGSGRRSAHDRHHTTMHPRRLRRARSG